jgi:LPXTG-motif cell wall-anchored protein
MTNRSAIRLAAAAAILACASTGNAQQADTTTLEKPAVNAASCTDITWQKAIVARYPNIAAACQEVVVSNGTRFARFTGELVQVSPKGSVIIDFKDRDGRSLGKPTTLQPAPTQRALIEGRYYRLSELMPGQQLSMYVPEAGLTVATEPVVASVPMAKMVLDEPGAPAEVPPQSVRLAETAPQPAATQSARLPDTAGWTPLLALAGVLALGGGIALAVRRRFRDGASV